MFLSIRIHNMTCRDITRDLVPNLDHETCYLAKYGSGFSACEREHCD